jgi:hypothetical protein
MDTLEDFAAKALAQRGDPYVFGAEARFKRKASVQQPVAVA